jgi:hypothetical protein
MSHPLNTPLSRFGIVTFQEGWQRCIASIPASRMINPLTRKPTVAALAMLVDHIGGLVNHHRRGPEEWTVSSELSLEFPPDALAQIAAAPEVPVIASGRPYGRKGPNSLGLCELTHRYSVVATASVRSFLAISSNGPKARQVRCLPVRLATGWWFGSPRAAVRRKSSCRIGTRC